MHRRCPPLNRQWGGSLTAEARIGRCGERGMVSGNGIPRSFDCTQDKYGYGPLGRFGDLIQTQGKRQTCDLLTRRAKLSYNSCCRQTKRAQKDLREEDGRASTAFR